MKFILLSAGLVVLGIAAGAGAAFMIPANTEQDPAIDPAQPQQISSSQSGDPVYINLANQFVIPVVERGLVRAMVIVTLSLETNPLDEDRVRLHEPRLRDQFLQVLFNHANAGKFSGLFTNPSIMGELREGLLTAAQDILGAAVSDVLIVDILRQDS